MTHEGRTASTRRSLRQNIPLGLAEYAGSLLTEGPFPVGWLPGGRVADVEAAVGDRGVGPGFGLAPRGRVGRGEAAQFPIPFGSGLDQRHSSVLAVEVEAAVGIAEGRRADGTLFPLHFAGGVFHTEQ